MLYLDMIGIEPLDLDGSKRLKRLLKYFQPGLILMPNSYSAFKDNLFNNKKLQNPEDYVSELNLWREKISNFNEKTFDILIRNRFYKDVEVTGYSKRNNTPVIFLNIEEEISSKNSLDQTVEKILKASPEVARAIIEKKYSEAGKQQLSEKAKKEHQKRDNDLITKLSGIMGREKVTVYGLGEIANHLHKIRINDLEGNIILIGSAEYIFGDYKSDRYKKLKTELKELGIKGVNRIKLNEADKPQYKV